MLIEKWNVVDAFYMTIITISTVGYGEVLPLSLSGKMFTSVLIITSFGTFAFAVTSITSYIMGGEYKRYYQHHKLNQMVKKLEKHVIVCGLGRVGRQAVKELKAHGQSFVCLEKKEEVVEYNRSSKSWMIVEGDATEDQNLLRANLLVHPNLQPPAQENHHSHIQIHCKSIHTHNKNHKDHHQSKDSM